jgi:hypothetical protein
MLLEVEEVAEEHDTTNTLLCNIYFIFFSTFRIILRP